MNAMPSPTPGNPDEMVDLIINWSAVVIAGFTLLLTVFTLIFIFAGFFGIRELSSIRRTGRESREKADAQLVEVSGLMQQIRDEFSSIDDRLNVLVEVSYLFNQGEAAYREGAYEKAVEFLGRAATLDPKNQKVLYRLGRSLTNLGDDLAAAMRFRDARDLGMTGGSADRGLALTYRYSQPSQALRHAQQAVQADEANPRNWNCLGLVLRDSGDMTGSRRAHERAADLDRESATTPFYLALLEAHPKASQRAITESHEAVYRLETQERRGKVKPIWADLIRWADYILRGQYAKAEELIPPITASCTSRRRAQEVCGHMDFLLRALEREGLRQRYLGPIERRWPQVASRQDRSA